MKRYVRAAIRDLSEEPREVLLALAEDPRTRADTLTEISNQILGKYNLAVTLAIMSNPNAPDDLLVKYSDRAYKIEVHVAIAKNPNAPEEALRKLFDCKEYRTDAWLLKNPNTPKDLIPMLQQRHRRGAV